MMSKSDENSKSLVYCSLAVESNYSFNWSGFNTRSIIARAITVTGLCSTKGLKTGLNIFSTSKSYINLT